MSNEGVSKSAILLMALGEDEAAEILKYLGPRDVQKLGTAMAALDNVSRDDIRSAVAEFRDGISVLSPLAALDQSDYIRSVMRKALGDDKAAGLIDRILATGESSGIEGLKWMDPTAVAELIKNEHPQILATILVHLDPDHACEILNQFTERLRNDCILRIATLDGVQPSALKELNDVLARLLAGGETTRKARLGGVRAAAEILNFMGKVNEQSVMANLETHDGPLAQKIMDEMFTFDDLVEVDDKGFQTILREVSSEQLVVALRGAPTELRDKVLRNMSKRAAETLREDLEGRGPVKVSEVESAQKDIITVVRRLSEEGQIQMGGKGGGDDAYV
jgi:flagellar motor switch protein FliG